MAEDAKRILILMAEKGFGHQSAARALAAALGELYGERCQVQIANPLNEAPAFLRDSQEDYDRAVRQMPNLYRLGYEISDSPLPTAVIESAFTVLMYDLMRDTLRRYRPDVIICVYQDYLAPLGAVLATARRRIPLISVITDLVTIHRMWFNDAVDLCLVPTDEAYQLALEYGLKPGQVRLTGIPVSPAYARPPRPRAELRGELGWDPDLAAVLAVGSTRVTHLAEAVHVLNHSGLPLQLVLVAGGDQALYDQLKATEWHRPTHVYKFVDDMPKFMAAADCVLGKAGGLIVTESLAAGRPILLTDVIEGHETGNAQYVIDNGAGEWAHSPLEVLEIMCHWLDHECALLRTRSQNACRLGRSRAAYDIAELAWTAAQAGPRSAADSSRLPSLTNLLNRFNISWEEKDTSD